MEIDFYIVLITFAQEERCELIGTVNNSAEMKTIIKKDTLLKINFNILEVIKNVEFFKNFYPGYFDD